MKRTEEDDKRDYLTIGKLRKLLDDTPKEQDNCLVGLYESSGKFDYAYPVKGAYVGKTYIRDTHYSCQRTLQLQFEDKYFEEPFWKPEYADDIDLKYGIERLKTLLKTYEEALSNYKEED